MPVEQAACPHHDPVPVQQLRAGDHAFVRYDTDTARWETAAAFVRTGLDLGERVIVLASPLAGRKAALTALRGHTPAFASARSEGRLVLSTMRELIAPRTEFTEQRQWERLTEETGRAVRDGCTGARAFIDMDWVRDLGTGTDAVVHRESHSHHLFTGRPYTELCAYDGRWFSKEVLAEMCSAHPRRVLAGLGILRTVSSPGAVRLAGEADLNTRTAFTAALRDGLAQSAGTGRLTADLTPLHFLSIGCAADLLLIASTAPHHRIEVRCAPFQAATLRRLGAETLMSLKLVEVEVGCGC
ncbi:MEDS domain-containing protein [Streptomyces sp. 549]|uniref:MEDS domain-containing protein n=1 Tax=Streptomyces sp. 549 TaxID=3049076 RepID=UPI0024C28D1A|nr:MEDS domain-containing protein [Streptomyces sp. 549]MDK1473133.1 MEDS domain-containing protein [Streptomyces sp. 549]